MRRLIETIKEIILLFLLIGFGSAIIDFARISAGKIPWFCVKSFDTNTRIEKYQGLFYNASRRVHNNREEELIDSSDINYKLFSMNIAVPNSFQYGTLDYELNIKESDNCNSKLYYADINNKIYLSCIDSIELLEKSTNKKYQLKDYLINNNIIEDILNRSDFIGLNNDILEFHSKSTFTNKVKIYKCHKKNINDIYIVSKDNGIRDDFCTYKDDDKDFIWKVVDENTSSSDSLEIIYEDDNYIYELEEGNKNNIYILYPSVRGREEEKIPLMDIISNKKYSMDELINKGLKIHKSKKEE